MSTRRFRFWKWLKTCRTIKPWPSSGLTSSRTSVLEGEERNVFSERSPPKIYGWIMAISPRALLYYRQRLTEGRKTILTGRSHMVIRIAILLFTFALTCFTASAGNADAKKALAALQGVWKL